MIKFTSGDMFETNADIRINTVNCVGVMGAGVALAFKNKYPDMYKDYQRECKKEKVKPGKMHIWKNLTGDWIINFPTKDHWRKPSRYEDIETGLIALRTYLLDKGPIHITLPALGCGNGGLDWNRVKRMIEEHLGNLDANIDVFEPLDSHKAGSVYRDKDIKISEEMLTDQGVKIIQPDMDMFPSTLRGKMASSLYIKGNDQFLEQPILAFFGSQKPDEKEVNAALAYLDLVARPGLSIMVGYAPHLDRPVIRRALELGSNVIISFPEGLLKFRVRNDLKDVWDDKRISVLTLASPKQKWSPQVASEAKHLSLAFANAALITDKNPKWLSRSIKSMKVNVPLFYANYEDLGSELSKSLKSVNAILLGDITPADCSHVAPLLESLGLICQSMSHSITESPIVPVSNVKIVKPFTDVASAMIYENESSYESPAKLVEEDNMREKNMIRKSKQSKIMTEYNS